VAGLGGSESVRIAGAKSDNNVRQVDRVCVGVKYWPVIDVCAVENKVVNPDLIHLVIKCHVM
jgi:hypothetical protein